jgi:heme-degrading monooxygenase HmoA
MITEHALLNVRSGQESAFEAAMNDARHIIATMPGFSSLEVRPAAEQSGLYLLLVQWETIAHHRDGFRKSDAYQSWRALLHHFYKPMPTVAYFGESIFHD